MQETLKESFRLSPHQRHLSAMQREEERFPFHAYYAARLEGPFEISRLRQALQRLVERYEILRTSFSHQPGGKLPVQVVQPALPLPFAVYDYRALDLDEQEAALKHLRAAMISRCFTLHEGPAWQMTLAICAVERQVLLWDLSALCADTKTCQILLHELSQLYAQETDEEVEERLQYGELAEWQYELLESEETERGRAYWHFLQQAGPQDVSLPYELATESLASFTRRSLSITISPTEQAQLETMAQKLTVSPATVLLTCWGCVLSYLSGQSSLPICSAYSGRTYGELDEAIGPLAKCLPLSHSFKETTRFSEIARQIEATQQEAGKWQAYFDWSLCESLTGQGPEPFAACGFDYETLPAAWQAGLLHWVIEEQESCLERFKVSLSCLETPQGILVTLHYDAHKFTWEDMQHLLTQWYMVFQQMLASPESTPGSLQFLTSDERRQLLLDWNATRADFPQESCLHQQFDMQARQAPDRIALSAADEQLSYQELNQRANQLAHYLRTCGVGPEVRVGICMERSLEMTVAVLGVLKAGGAYVPLDPTYPQERLSFMLADSQIALLLTQRRFAAQFLESGIRTICLDNWQEFLHTDGSYPPLNEAEVQNAASIIYISGASGQPEGVVVTHHALANYMFWMQRQFPLAETERVLQKTSFSLDASLWEFYAPLFAGAQLVMARPELQLDSNEFLQTIQQQQITILQLVPAHLQLLLEVPEFAACRSLKRVFCSGEELPIEVQMRFFACLAASLHHLYGPTEATIDATCWTCERDTARSSIPIGRPISNTQLYLLNPQGQLVPSGVVGEIYIGGSGLARGYFNRPAQTAERFIPHPFSNEPGARLYRTGDLARYLPDGDLEYRGRVDQQVKVHGFRIEPGEIEAQIRQHPAIQECVVLAHTGTSGDRRLVAYVVLHQRQTLREINLRASLQTHLPFYMIPALFMPLAAFPRMPDGKLDRKKLLEIEVPEGEGAEYFVAPRSSVEETLADIWAQVLHREHIGMHDNFFALGGDSIISIQVVTRARQAGLQITPRQLFQYQTIAQLAGIATSALPAQAEQTLVTGPVVLTPIQHWFFAHHLPERHHYNQAVVLESQQALHPAWLDRALLHLILHHDALRLRFVQNRDGWQQEIAGPPSTQPFFQCVDLSGLPRNQQHVAQTMLTEQAQASLNLASGLLLRGLFFVHGSGQGDHLLLIIHHLAIDGVSWRILREDLEALYHQLSRHEQLHLAGKTASWQQWARLLQSYGQAEAFLATQDYWFAPQRKLVTPLPVDLSRAENMVADSETLSVSLSAQQTQVLLQEVPSAYRTHISDVLLTALTQAFATWTGEQRLLIDLEGHGREEPTDEIDLARTVGWFTTLFPVLLDLGQATDQGAALKTIKEQLRQVPHRGLSYGVLRYLSSHPQVIEARAHLPEAEVVFNYLGQFASAAPTQVLFRPAHVSSGTMQSKLGMRSHLLEINGGIIEGELRFAWQYGRRVHHRETIQRLAQRFIDCLAQLCAHCQALTISAYTPSDFPLAAFDQQQLDRLLQQLPQNRLEGRDQQLEDIYPLSPMQAGLLFHCLYTPESAIYCGYFSWIIRGAFLPEAWEWAWQQVIARHAILRTAFVWQGLIEPVQVVYKHAELPWIRHDWRGLSEQERQQRLSAFRQEEERKGVDLQQAPLLRLALIQLEDHSYFFHLSLHHLLLDGWSLALLVGEVLDYYHAYRQEKKPLLAPARLYREYIAWLHQQNMAQAEHFWRGYLAGFTSPTKLSIDHSYTQRKQSRQERETALRHIPEEITVALQRLGRDSRLTLNTIVQGCWALLLAHYSGEAEVLFGTTVAGRPAELVGVETMVGLFINTLPVRVPLKQDASLLSWLTWLQEQQSELRQYEYTPLVEIQRWSEVPGEQPLFESLLLFQNYPLASLKPEVVNELTIQGERSREYTSYALTLKAIATSKTFTLQLAYDSSRFTASTIARFMDHLQMLLEVIAWHPQQQLAEVPLLTTAERRTLLLDWNATRADFSGERCIHELFEQQARLTPDAIALVYEESCLTYQQVQRAARRVAGSLQARGIEVGAPVGLCVERSLAMVIGMLGILQAGGAYVPLDPTYPRERLSFMLADSQAVALVTQPWLTEIFADQSTPQLVYLSDALAAHDWSKRASRQESSQQIAYILYTSGSTGRPKGTMIAHRALANFFASMSKRPGMTQADHVLAVTSFSFDIAALELLQPLLLGACIHIASQQVTTDGYALSALLETSGATILQATPSTWEMLLLSGWQGNHHIKMLCGGEALPMDLAVQLQQRGAALWNMYGPTETTIWSAIEDLSSTDTGISIGHGIDNTQLYVLDSRGALVPIGGVGELYIAGEGLAYGYWKRPDISAERFLPNPFTQQAGSRMYRTGDQVRWLENGRLAYLGRRDQQVKLRGFRIEPGEIEIVLREHPAVQEAVVILREENAAHKYLAAYIVAQSDRQPTHQELQAHLLKHLPRYMVPASFVYLEALPLTLNGKVHRQALPAPDPAQGNLSNEFVAPETELQQQLSEIWIELLHLPQVGIQDNFFELGGHSLLATRLMMRISSEFLVEVPLRMLFTAPTIAQLALVIEQEQDKLIEQVDYEEVIRMLEA